jgi:hypothetical protein
MKNTLTICQLPDGRYKTEIDAYDGSTVMEIHRAGLHDSKVLRKIQEKNYYQRWPGTWYIVFAGQQHVIHRPSLESAIDVAQEYIFSRDNTIDYSGFC